MGEKELEKNIEDFSRALKQGHAAVYRRDYGSEAYEYVGNYIEEITGYPPEELTPAIWDSLIIRAETKGALAGLPLEECYRLNRTGEEEVWQADMQLRTRSGETRWVTDMSTALRDESGKCFGCLGVLQDITERKETETQLAKLTEQLRLRNQEMESDLAMAREVQQALVTKQPKQFPPDAEPNQASLLFHHRYIPATELAGDFFDILPLSENEAGVFICDVMGHGLRAALLTTFLRGLIEELMPLAGDPGRFLGKINHGLRAVFGQAETFIFASAVYLVVDAKTRRVRFANAGHPQPLCLRPDAGTIAILENDGGAPEPALGIVEDFEYSTTEYIPGTRESLLLYTDGLVEAHNANEEMYGEARLEKFIRQHAQLAPDALLDKLIGDVHHFSGSDDFEDDVCLLTVEPA